jgi:hypothetical protein
MSSLHSSQSRAVQHFWEIKVLAFHERNLLTKVVRSLAVILFLVQNPLECFLCNIVFSNVSEGTIVTLNTELSIMGESNKNDSLLFLYYQVSDNFLGSVLPPYLTLSVRPVSVQQHNGSKQSVCHASRKRPGLLNLARIKKCHKIRCNCFFNFNGTFFSFILRYKQK